MKPYCFSRNEIISSNDASIHPMDIALIRGYGIFDFFRTSSFVPLFLEDYLDRFTASAQKTHLQLGYCKAELSEIIHELISKNNLENGGIRMLLTGGVSANHFSPSASDLFIFCEDLDFPAASKYENGIKLLAVEHVRAIAEVKTTNYAFPVWHSAGWKSSGAEDVLYHIHGDVSESSRSNIFLIKDGRLATPKDNVLHGITRKRVMELAGNVEVRKVSMDEILNADELFITSTTKKILPVTRIDDAVIGTGQPGPVTRKLMDDFKAMESKLTMAKQRGVGD